MSPDTELHEARELLVRSGRRRLAVVGSDGRFLGLLCLKRTHQGFCSDLDVRARTRAGRAGAGVAAAQLM